MIASPKTLAAWQSFSRFANWCILRSSLGANLCDLKSRWCSIRPADYFALVYCRTNWMYIKEKLAQLAVTKLLWMKLELTRSKSATLKYKIRWRKVESRKCLKGCTSCILINPVQNFMMWWQKVRRRLIWAQEIFEAHGWSNSKSG